MTKKITTGNRIFSRKNTNKPSKSNTKKTVSIVKKQRNPEYRYPEFIKKLKRHQGIDYINEPDLFDVDPEENDYDFSEYRLKTEDIPKEIVKYHRKVLREKFGDYVLLFNGKFPIDMIFDKKINIKDIRKKLLNSQCSSWSDDPEVSLSFSEDYGIIVVSEIPIENILISHFGTKILSGESKEREFIVDKIPENIAIYNIEEFKNLVKLGCFPRPKGSRKTSFDYWESDMNA